MGWWIFFSLFFFKEGDGKSPVGSCTEMCMGVSAETEQWGPSLPDPLHPLRRWLSLGLDLGEN